MGSWGSFKCYVQNIIVNHSRKLPDDDEFALIDKQPINEIKFFNESEINLKQIMLPRFCIHRKETSRTSV